MTAELAPHPVMVVSTERGGTQLHTLRPTHFVDPGEQNLFNFSCGRWSAGIEKSGVVGRTRWFIPAPSLSLPLARFQRLRADPSDNNVYIKDKRMVCLTYRVDFEVIRNYCVPQDLTGALTCERHRNS